MPILYTCVLNRRNDVVLEGFFQRQVISYKKEVLKLRPQFAFLGKRVIDLNPEDKLNLYYDHRDEIILVCVAQNVMKWEMGKFLDKINQCVERPIDEWKALGGTASNRVMPFQEVDAEKIYAN